MSSFRGYSAWRYGAGEKKSRVKMPQIFAGQQREHIVGVVKRSLADWKTSVFEHEADCRHGLRSALCLQGHNWEIADNEAATLVSTGLDRLHAQRPTWEEGQRKYVDPRENCAHCGTAIREDDYGVRGRFCSPECAKLAIDRWNDERAYHTTSIGRSAYELMRRARKTNACQHCGSDFHPQPDSPNQKYCSHACYHAHGLDAVHAKECEWCSKPFRAGRSDARFCSKSCIEVQRQVRSGKWVPQRVSAPVFDHFITMPVNAAWPRPVTPARFDAMAA